MIRNYNIDTAFASLAKPTGISQSYFNTNESGFTLDYLYGPYDVPENEGILSFSYEDEDENIIIRPTQSIDGDPGPEGTWNYNEQDVPVYNTRLDYQKALAEQMLTDMKQFFIGKRVAFITDEGKAKEYVVAPIPNSDPVELHFEDADLLDIYTVKFETVNGVGGAQADVQTVSKFYSLSKSEFDAPTETYDGQTVPQLFEGWHFGYTDSGALVIGDTAYQVGQSVNLADLCDTHNITNREVTFYAQYMNRDAVAVDFKNGYYKADGSFADLDGGDDMGGYMKVQDALDQDNEKPEDWDRAYASYFTRNETHSPYCSYSNVSWRKVWRWLGNNAVSDTREWTQDHFATWFPNGTWNTDPSLASNMLSSDGSGHLQFVYTPGADETGLSDKDKVKARNWYMITVRGDGFGALYTYTPCESDYDDYEHSDLYTHIVRDSFSMFDNGSVMGDVHYDCMDGTHFEAFQGTIVKLNTTISDLYSDRYEFDRWEVVPMKWEDDGMSEIENATETYTSINPSFRLDTEYIPQDATDSENPVSADGYIFRAVYRKRDEYYCRLHLATNSGSGTPSGTVAVTCKYVRARRPNLYAMTVGTLDSNGDYTLNPNLEHSNVVQLTQDGFEFDPNVVKFITLTANVNTQGGMFYCWTDGSSSRGPILADIPTSMGEDLSYKAWFATEGDVKAKVKVGRRLNHAGNIATSFNGSTVGIYGWMYANAVTGEAVSGNNQHMLPDRAYLYNESAYGELEEYYPVTARTNNTIDTIQAITNTGAENSQRFIMQIDETVQLDNPSYITIDETGHGYCFVKATEGQNNGARFLMWSDGNTSASRLVDVTLPTEYQFTAIFEGTPMSLSDDRAVATVGIHDLSILTENVHPSTNELSESLLENTMRVDIDGVSVFVHADGVGSADEPAALDSCRTVSEIIAETIPTQQPQPTGSEFYDASGNLYEGTTIALKSTLEITK